MPVTVEDLPEVLPSGDVNIAKLNKLRIERIAKDAGHFVTDTQICVTGHVDSGKSSLTANILKHCGVLQEKALKEEENKIIARKGDDYKPTALEIATRSVEKGKEAKDRGMTIEVHSHELPMTETMFFAKDSAEYKEAVELLQHLGKKYEDVDAPAVGPSMRELRYPRRLIFNDAPGHKDFISPSNESIVISDAQIVMVPSDSGSGEGAGDDPFLTALTKGSMSVAHARVGLSQNVLQVYVLSKADTNTSEQNKEKDDLLRRALTKSLGIKQNKQIVVPSSSKDMEAHNVFRPSPDIEYLKYYKGQDVDITVKDYRNPKRVYNVKAHINCVFDVIAFCSPIICVKGQYNNRGTLLFIAEIAPKTSHGVVYIGKVMSNVLSTGDVLRSVQNPDCEYRVESMEQFLKPVQNSPVKSLVGVKLKSVSKNKAPVVRHDLLHCDYPANNIPISCLYMEVKMLYFPASTTSSTKSTESKLGTEYTLVCVHRCTFSIVNVLSYKSGKEAEVKATPENPINSWPRSNTILHCIVKFKHLVNLPTMDQADWGNVGNFLSSKEVTGSVKLLKHRLDGESLDIPLKNMQKKKKVQTTKK